MPGRLLGDRDGARLAAPRGRRPWDRHACGSPGRDGRASARPFGASDREAGGRLACLTLMVRDPSVLRSDDTKRFGAKHQSCPQLVVHGPPESSLAVRAAEMGAAIRCSLVGDFPSETETVEPLTSNPEPWSPPIQLLPTLALPVWVLALSRSLSPSTRERPPPYYGYRRRWYLQCREADGDQQHLHP